MSNMSRAQFLRGGWKADHSNVALISGGLAQVQSNCLAQNRVDCHACGDHCELSAISFAPRLNAPPAPVVNLDLCNGCGACIDVCPVRAIQLVHEENQSKQTPDLERGSQLL